MSSNISIVKSTGWDAAIEDAKKHIERLRGVIAACEEKKPRENLGLEPLLRYMASRMPNLRTATQCLRHYQVRDQGVGGSNPLSPTNFKFFVHPLLNAFHQ